MRLKKRMIVGMLLAVLLCMPFAALGEEEQPRERSSTELPGYESDALSITVTQRRWTYKKHTLVFYVAHVQMKSPAQLRTAFARDTFHKTYTEDTLSIAQRAGAVLAVNGDYYNHDDKAGVVLRNGELYRDLSCRRDLLFIDTQGAAHVILRTEREGEMGRTLLDQGAVHAFEFGPALVRDGEALPVPEKYFISTAEEIREPRTALGWVDGLHYVFIVADGRRSGWSDKGMTLRELQSVLLEEGCSVGYNLDGGGSATLYMNGEIISQPSGGSQRKVSDIIVIVDGQ